jgi:peptidoglycan/LPS O-acetylase OafA/YrhL
MDRVQSLDGLRGLAIALVVLVHTGLLPGGGHGVALFFVLSGFLITRLLVTEADSGHLDLKRFYWNRSLRLLPALLLMVTTVALTFPQTDWIWTVTYTANYAGIAGEPVQNLVHTWSLAVEEHFYLLWPVAIAWIPRRARPRWIAALLMLAVGWRLALLVAGASYTWVYAATDTSAYALLAGCLIAVVDWKPSRAATMVGVSGILGVSMWSTIGTYGYLWDGFLIVGFSTLAVAGCSVHRIRPMEARWLAGLGVISYGVYLWHLPLLNSGLSVPEALALTLAISIVSWRVVEMPLRRFRLAEPRADNRLSSVKAVM